jgi:MFS family permease
MAADANPPVFASLLTDRLQGPRLGFLLGLQNIGFGAGAMLGPVFAGALFDWRGSHTLAFLASAAAALGSTAVVSTARVLRGAARE